MTIEPHTHLGPTDLCKGIPIVEVRLTSLQPTPKDCLCFILNMVAGLIPILSWPFHILIRLEQYIVLGLYNHCMHVPTNGQLYPSAQTCLSFTLCNPMFFQEVENYLGVNLFACIGCKYALNCNHKPGSTSLYTFFWGRGAYIF